MPRRSAHAALRKAWHKGLNALTGQVMRAAKDVARGAQSAVPDLTKTPKHPSPGLGDWLAGVATGRGGMRRFRLFRPFGLTPGERVPLIVMLHGCGQDPAGFAASTRMNRLAARERCLVLYPAQSRLANPQRCWNWFDIENGRAQAEAALILAAIDQACVLYPADRSRVVIAGLSAGAGMAALMATTWPERFRAVAMHAGVAPGLATTTASALRAMRGDIASAALGASTAASAASMSSTAKPLDWPPLLVIQGTKDAVVAPSNGREALRLWAQASGATTERTRTVQRGRRLPMTVVDVGRGRAVNATLVEIEGLGHAWSGGAANASFSDPTGPDATAMIWRFFAKRL
ncbi:alpha/beta hydrolase family esterase [Roseateles sp. So40a]|uniref:extracellular catalytic domain type 1 short-chain-length polyhydroxyalkanoate depolymerase n=1 Tax=Roseateles sp. So40a TaxID=3400226 RepID=UPI003A8BC2A4